MNRAPSTTNPRANFTHARAAFTRRELLVITVILIILFAVVLPAITKGIARQKRIACVGHLKNIGLAARIFATDNADLFPWEANVDRFRDLSSDQQLLHFYRSFSNALSSPKILICRADIRKPAFKWPQLTTNNLSYFLATTAQETYPQSILAGDRNLTLNGSRISGHVTINSNAVIAWDQTMHKFQGNVTMGDGSVQQSSNARIKQQFKNTGLPTNTFLIP
jgi:Tfp pilus assembly protein PilE